MTDLVIPFPPSSRNALLLATPVGENGPVRQMRQPHHRAVPRTASEAGAVAGETVMSGKCGTDVDTAKFGAENSEEGGENEAKLMLLLHLLSGKEETVDIMARRGFVMMIEVCLRNAILFHVLNV